QRVRIAGRGSPGARGGASGDLYLVMRVGGHLIFRRDGDNIHVTVPITVSEAALGAKIEVPTVEGRAMLKVPPGTQSGQKLRMREKGVKSAVKEGVIGDEIVEVKIVAPQIHDERSKEILRELAKLNPEDPRKDLWNKV
ncbi:MAG: DnaJ C-terminal domain-containing protein, partial [Terriglobales bacterium]